MKPPLKERLKDVGEHTALIISGIFASLLIAIATLVGIYVINYIVPRMFGSTSGAVEVLSYYSGVEAVIIFVLASISLIRYLFSEQDEGGDGSDAKET
jgi:hypothetical protein